MPTCFDLIGGYLVESAQTLQNCTGFVIKDAATYQAEPSLGMIFNVPLEGLSDFFALGLAAPFICYMAAWSMQQVINMFEKHS